MEQRKNIRTTHEKTHKAPYPLTRSRKHTYRNPAENTKKIGYYKTSIYDRSPYRIRQYLKVNTAIIIFILIDKHKHFM